MTRDEVQDALWDIADDEIYSRSKKSENAEAAVLAHDAKQRVLIEQLNEKVAAYEGGCLHDQLVAHAQKIEQLEQQNTALRGGVARTCTTMGR